MKIYRLISSVNLSLTHDKPAGHLDGGIGQAAVPLLAQNVLRLGAHRAAEVRRERKSGNPSSENGASLLTLDRFQNKRQLTRQGIIRELRFDESVQNHTYGKNILRI